MATIARLETIISATMQGFDKVQTSFQQLDRQMGALEKSVGGATSAIGTATKMLGAFGMSLSAAAVVGFAKEIGEFAGNMLDLSAETKVSTDALQAFNIAGSDVGLTVEDIVRNMDQLAKRVGSGDKSAVDALEKLNINVEEFKRLGLEDALFLIDRQMTGVTNQFEIGALRADLFGKAGQAMGRMMDGSLQNTIDNLKKTNSIISKDMLESADRLDDGFKRLWIDFRAYSAWAIMGAIDMMGKISFPNKGNVNLPGGSSFIGPPASTATGLVNGSGVPAVDTVLEKAREATEKLDREYVKLMGDVANDRGLMLMAQDAAFLNSTLSETTRKLQSLAMNIGPLGVMQSGRLNPALLMGGPGAMPYGGNLYGTNSGHTPLLNMGQSFMGGLTGGFKNLWGGMTGGGGIGGLFKNIGGGISQGIGNMLGGLMTGGIGAVAGLAIGGLGKLFGKMFGGEGKKTNDLRDQMFGSMGGFDAVAKSAAEAGFSMDRLLQPSKVKDMQRAWEDFNRALEKHQELANNIAQLTDAQAQRQQMLQDALSRYNFTAVEKGPLINMQEMAAQAEQLLTDYQLLSEAGVDHAAVLREMSSSVSDFVNRAIKTGTEVPEAMRAMIEEMIKNGELLDENGVAFTSLEQAGIHFGESLTNMFKGVLQKLDELIDKLNQAIGATQTLNSLPTSGVVGSDILNSDIVPMAAGGMGTVTRPTLFMAGENGPEQYAFSGGGRSFGGGGGADMRGMRADLKQFMRTLPLALRDAVLLAR